MQPLSFEWKVYEFPGDHSLTVENATAFLKVLPGYRRSGKLSQRTNAAALYKEMQVSPTRDEPAATISRADTPNHPRARTRGGES